MILATVSGWLVIVKPIEIKNTCAVVRDTEGNIYTVRNNDPTRKIFDNTSEAIKWIHSNVRGD